MAYAKSSAFMSALSAPRQVPPSNQFIRPRMEIAPVHQPCRSSREAVHVLSMRRTAADRNGTPIYFSENVQAFEGAVKEKSGAGDWFTVGAPSADEDAGGAVVDPLTDANMATDEALQFYPPPDKDQG